MKWRGVLGGRKKVHQKKNENKGQREEILAAVKD
jgi:hypothetical protein